MRTGNPHTLLSVSTMVKMGKRKTENVQSTPGPLVHASTSTGKPGSDLSVAETKGTTINGAPLDNDPTFDAGPMVMTKCRAGWREGYGEYVTPAPAVEGVCVDIEEDGIMILFVQLSTSTDTASLGGNILPRRA
jgi:hypothetical protein